MKDQARIEIDRPRTWKKLGADARKPAVKPERLTAEPAKENNADQGTVEHEEQTTADQQLAVKPNKYTAEGKEPPAGPDENTGRKRAGLRRTEWRTTQPQRLGVEIQPRIMTALTRDPLGGWSQTLFRLCENLDG